MSDLMRPLPFDALVGWALEEHTRHGTVFGLADRVSPEEWEEACRAIEREFRAARWLDGALLGIEAVTRLLVREFPRTGAPDVDEQPNRPRIF